ncbi:UNVERIFIED_CONTAM: TPP-dependent indolepyruvate ferredoxin oxidoreductase alpha subunit [Paenibacillus sp. PvR008]
MVDTCLCMGAGVTMAQWLKRVQPDTKLIAFIGDSPFFHSGITGMINAVYNQSD